MASDRALPVTTFEIGDIGLLTVFHGSSELSRPIGNPIATLDSEHGEFIFIRSFSSPHTVYIETDFNGPNGTFAGWIEFAEEDMMLFAIALRWIITHWIDVKRRMKWES